MAKYRINHGKVIKQTHEIDDLADDLQTEITRLNNAYELSLTEWQGPAADEFRRKLSSLISQISTTKDNMNSVARRIRAVANAIQAEDERQAEAAEALG